MGKFFNDKNPLAGFEDYLSNHKRPYATAVDPKEYEGAKTYSFLEYNYYRLKKIASLLHKKLFNLGSDEYFQKTFEDYQTNIKRVKKQLVENFTDPDHLFQRRQKEIYEHFFTRK